MAKKTDDLTEIKKNLKSDKLLIGTVRTLKNLKLGKLSKVYMSLNTPESVIKDVEYYGKLVETELVKLNMPNDELGIYCKKPYSVSVIGLLK